MDALSLKDALAVAARYTDPKGSDRNLHVVVLRDGFVRATNHTSGCEIPCPEAAGVDLAVDCAALRKMVNAIGDGVKLTKGKGRKLHVKGAGVEYKLASIPASSEPSFPDVPEAGWREVTKEQMVALGQISQVVDPKSSQTAFHGVRLTENWCAAATSSMMAFAWTALVDGEADRFTVPPEVFDDMGRAAELTVADDRLFLRDAKSGQVRWSLGLGPDWPDDSLAAAIKDAREKDRAVAVVKLGDLGLLCKQAAVVAESKVHAFRMVADADGVQLEGRQGVADFKGRVPVSDFTPASEAASEVGIDPSRLAMVCNIVEAAGGDVYYLTMAGPLSPILVWNHGAPVAIETLTMPMRLE